MHAATLLNDLMSTLCSGGEGWAEVDIWTLTQGGCYHVIEREVYDVRLALKAAI
jgi:hypothetical protein